MIKTITKLFLTFALLTSASVAFAGERFTQVRASHILVKTAPEALQIKKDIDAGGSFERYAQLYSLCPSGKNGGDLGYFGRGMMVKEFEVPSFNEPVGTVTEPIQTQFGWHLIHVIDKK